MAPTIGSFTGSPSGVTSSNNLASLSWSVTGFLVWLSNTPPAFSAGITSLTAAVVGGGAMLPGTYYYQINYGTTNPQQYYSNTVSVTVTDNSSSVQLSWPAVAGVTTYYVYRASNSFFTSNSKYQTTTETTFTDVGPGLVLDSGTVRTEEFNGDSSTVVSPTATTAYTLIARDTSNNTATAIVTITVSDTTAPTLSLASSSTSITAGQSVTLTLDWTFANSGYPAMDHGIGAYFAYYRKSITVKPYSTITYTATNSNSVDTIIRSATITVSGGVSIFESDHPYQNTLYSYQAPEWPGGTNTVYLTFSRDTFVDPWGGSFALFTDQTSYTYSDIQLAGYTVAISSSDGLLTMDTRNGGGSDEFYGFRVLSLSYTPPAATGYLLGNPNPADYISWGYASSDWDGPDSPYDFNNSAEGPNYVYADLSASVLRLTPAQQNMSNMEISYQYGMRFPNATGTPTFTISSGNLPPGLILSSGGLISGIPTGNSGKFGIMAIDGGISASGQFYIEVHPQPVWVGTTPGNAVGYAAEQYIVTGSALDYGFHRNGSRWCLITGSSTSTFKWPVMFQSLDDGLTWNHVGASMEPNASGVTGPFCTMYNTGVGDYVYAVTSQVVSGSQMNFGVWTFNTSMLTWTQLSSFNSAYKPSSGGTSFRFVVLSTGVWRLFWYGSASNGGDVGEWMVEYTPGTGWGSAIELWSAVAYNYINPSTGLTVTPAPDVNSIGHQNNSFTDDSVLDITHVTMRVDGLLDGQNANHLYYAQICSTGVLFSTQISAQIVHNSGWTPASGFPVLNKFNGGVMGLGSWKGLPSRNQMVLPTWVYLNDNDASTGIGPAVIRATLTSPPTLVCENVQAWNDNLQAYDYTVWGGSGQTMEYIGGCGLDTDGNLTLFWTNVGYLQESDRSITDSIYYAVNTAPASGDSAKGWTQPFEYWSGNWSPFDLASQTFGEFITAAPMSVEFYDGLWYVHFDGYPNVNPGEINITFPPANPYASFLLKNYTSGIGGAMGGPAGVLGNYAFRQKQKRRLFHPLLPLPEPEEE